MLTRRKESDTYLVTVGRHRWSPQIVMKVDKMCSFQPALRTSSAEEEATHFIHFHRNVQTPAMSTDSSQVGVALFSSC